MQTGSTKTFIYSLQIMGNIDKVHSQERFLTKILTISRYPDKFGNFEKKDDQKQLQ